MLLWILHVWRALVRWREAWRLKLYWYAKYQLLGRVPRSLGKCPRAPALLIKRNVGDDVSARESMACLLEFCQWFVNDNSNTCVDTVCVFVEGKGEENCIEDLLHGIANAKRMESARSIIVPRFNRSSVTIRFLPTRDELFTNAILNQKGTDATTTLDQALYFPHEVNTIDFLLVLESGPRDDHRLCEAFPPHLLRACEIFFANNINKPLFTHQFYHALERFAGSTQRLGV